MEYLNTVAKADCEDPLYAGNKENICMRVNVMKKGDSILNVTENMVVVKRRSGEVDVIPFCKEGNVWRIDQEHVVTIGYGNNTVEDSVADGNVTIMTF